MQFPGSLLLSVAAFAGAAAAQGVSTYVNPAVPTGTPIAANYTGPLRPQVHYSPPKGFMNDPNGMFYLNGVFHLYYQYNPTGLGAGNQQRRLHVGEPADRAVPPEERQYVFSGSVVVDANNTSGFFPNQNNGVVAVFTLARYNADGSGGPQTQAIAYSHDEGYTFQYYDQNPVINSTSSHFRDPKVIRHGDAWAMVVAYAQEFAVGIFTSPDLKQWTWASNFTNHGLLGAQYECPNIVKMPVRDRDSGAVVDEKYVITLSAQPGAPLGGSVTQYFIGDFNGTHFSTVDAATRLTDFAKDNYAAQFFYGVEGNPISMGWASNWQYAQQVPTGNNEGWRSAMTLPRVSYLTKAPRIGWTMVDEIYDPEPILGDSLASKTDMGNGSVTVDYADVASGALYVEANVTGIDVAKATSFSTLNLTFASPASGEALRSGFYLGGDNPFFVDRGGLRGFDNVFFTDKFSVADVYYDGAADKSAAWRVQAVLDRSLYEVFVGGGRHAGTVLLYPSQPLTLLTVAARDLPPGAKVSVAVWALKSTWAGLADEQGTVVGNVTAKAPAAARRHMVYEGEFSA
ncbi:beta-fructofuranosidase [Apiospora kogelbergensis]|uniref:Beta-fructofuranosidase n=1 Tax=Apiospora kogelbergensis TaxID=1337665 RepID=A0AAW0QKE7_9PEZI